MPAQRRGALIACFVGLSTLTPPFAAGAHEVAPMRMEITPAAGGLGGVFSIRNTRDKSLPFEVVMVRRVFNPDGTETTTVADDDFIVFPVQGLLEPGASQAVRFEYVGPIELAETQSYVMDVREVPVTPPDFSGIVTVYNFGAAIYVKPEGAQDQLEVVGLAREGDRITFEVRNSGNDYAILTRRDLDLQLADRRVTIEGPDFANRADAGVVPPNSVRRFSMRADDLPPGDPRSLRISRER